MKKTLIYMIACAMLGGIMVGCSGGSSSPTGTFDNSKMINVVTREEGSGTRGAFVELLGIEEKKADGNKVDRTTKEAITAMKTDIMLTNIAGDDHAIGYVSLGSLNDNVKAVKVDGVVPSSQTVKDGSYPIARPFNIATKSDVSEVAQDFIDFIMSKEGQDVIAKSYISVDEAALPYSGSKPSGKIVVAGSSSVSPIMEKLKEAYALVNPNAQIEVQQTDSSSGMTAVTEGTCDIGMASRSLKESEKEKLNALAIALDGIGIIVNPKNPLTELTSEQSKEIFIGNITNWSELSAS